DLHCSGLVLKCCAGNLSGSEFCLYVSRSLHVDDLSRDIYPSHARLEFRDFHCCSPVTTSPVAKLPLTDVILTFTWSPWFVPGTKTTKLLIRAIPSPRLPTESIVTSTSWPSSTGAGPRFLSCPRSYPRSYPRPPPPPPPRP